MNTTVQILFAAAVAIAAGDAAARDRPGTPNGEKAYACGDQFNQPPAVCVDVNNTASEPVRIEVDVTLNGVRMERGAVGGDVQCPERELHLTDEELSNSMYLAQLDEHVLIEALGDEEISGSADKNADAEMENYLIDNHIETNQLINEE